MWQPGGFSLSDSHAFNRAFRLNSKIYGVMNERRGIETQNRPFLRLTFSIYRVPGSSYSWQAFR
jgi:hypothetical protein